MPPLEVGELYMEESVEEQIGGLDVAVEDAPAVNPRDSLGGLAAPGQPLLDRRKGFAGFKQILRPCCR